MFYTSEDLPSVPVDISGSFDLGYQNSLEGSFTVDQLPSLPKDFPPQSTPLRGKKETLKQLKIPVPASKSALPARYKGLAARTIRLHQLIDACFAPN